MFKFVFSPPCSLEKTKKKTKKQNSKMDPSQNMPGEEEAYIQQGEILQEINPEEMPPVARFFFLFSFSSFCIFFSHFFFFFFFSSVIWKGIQMRIWMEVKEKRENKENQTNNPWRF